MNTFSTSPLGVCDPTEVDVRGLFIKDICKTNALTFSNKGVEAQTRLKNFILFFLMDFPALFHNHLQRIIHDNTEVKARNDCF